jgi:hypothetical protein
MNPYLLPSLLSLSLSIPRFLALSLFFRLGFLLLTTNILSTTIFYEQHHPAAPSLSQLSEEHQIDFDFFRIKRINFAL